MTIREELATALRTLPKPHGRDSALHERLIQQEAAYLSRLTAKNWQRRYHHDRVATATQLKRFAKALEHAATEAALLDADAQLALYHAGMLHEDDDANDVAAMLRAQAAEARQAADAVAHEPSGPGQLGKARARAVAIRTLRAFEKLTGKRPTLVSDRVTNRRSGPFLALVKSVFNALDVHDSAESIARTAIETCRQK